MRWCTSVQIVLLVFLVVVTQSQAQILSILGDLLQGGDNVPSTSSRRLEAETSTTTVNSVRIEAATTTAKRSTATVSTKAPPPTGGTSSKSTASSSDTGSDRGSDNGTMGIPCIRSNATRCDAGQVCWFKGDAAVGKCVAESSLASLNSAPSNQMAMLTFSIAVALLWACVLI